MRIIVNGAAGRMGKTLVELIRESSEYTLVCAADRAFASNAEKPFAHSVNTFSGNADCLIDFSHHSAARTVCGYCIKRGLPLVMATTGQTAGEREIIAAAASQIPVFFSANMSAGAALAARLVKTAASFFPEAEIEIVETHRSEKSDLPSGTALMIADEIKRVRPDSVINVGRRSGGKRSKNEIGIHSLRMGNCAGRHEVYVCAGSQTVRIIHEAHDGTLFAEGALAAAKYIVRKLPGIYTMRNIADEN